MKSQRRSRSCLVGGGLLLASLSLTSCQEREPESRVKKQRILDGVESENDSVVAIYGSGSGSTSLCTGTIIAPKLVLTARHCISVYTEGQYTCTLEGELDRSSPRQPANAGEIGALFKPEDIELHLGQRPSFTEPTGRVVEVLAPEADEICRNDIALLVLEEELPGTPSPVRIGEGLSWKETVAIAGYGLNELRLNERRERGELDILGIGPSQFFEQEGQAMPRTFVIGRAACPGDSGGPAFSEETGEVVGVFSLFRGDCTSGEARDFYTQVAPFEELLREGFAAAGAAWPVADESGLPGKSEEPTSEGGGAGVAGSSGAASHSPSSGEGGCRFAAGEGTGGAFFVFAWSAVLLGAGRRRREET